MNNQRRQQLIDKFPQMAPGARPMDPALNTTVQAILRAEKINNLVWRWAGFDPGMILFDPARVPALAERADVAAADFHRRAGQDGALRYDTADTDYDPHDPAEQGAVAIWRVGTNSCDIVRDRWHDAPNRTATTTDYAAQLFRHLIDMLDHWYCGGVFGCDGDCDLKCNVNIAQSCSGTTRLMPVNRGALVMLFRCCWDCEALAGKIAANNYKISVKLAEIEARETP